jgi:hypothetical protein
MVIPEMPAIGIMAIIAAIGIATMIADGAQPSFSAAAAPISSRSERLTIATGTSPS